MAVQGQMGFKTEVTPGTAVTVDKFHGGWLSGNPVVDQKPLVSRGMRGGRRTPTCVSRGPKKVVGQFNFELMPAPMATLLKHLLGTVGTTGAGPYEHTATLASLTGDSFTAQVGIPDSGGTVRPFTYKGCKIQQASIKANLEAIATMDLTVVAMDYVTATALASASYLDACPFTFVHGSVTVDGTPVTQVQAFEWTLSRSLRTEVPQGQVTIDEPLETDMPEIRVSVETEFKDLTLHDLANTDVAIVLDFDNGTEELEITTNVFLEPTTPQHTGLDGKLIPFPFTGMVKGATDADALSMVLTNGEASAA